MRLLPILVAGAAMLTVTAKADDFDRKVCSLFALTNKGVQHDMGVTPAQREKLNTAAKAFNDEFARLHKPNKKPTKEEFAHLQVLYDKMQDGVFKTLTAAQISRLRQISLQLVGVRAFREPIVAKKVGLTASQVARISDIIDNADKQAQTYGKAANFEKDQWVKGHPNADDKTKQGEALLLNKKYGPMLGGVIKKSADDISGVLTPAQKATWKGLLGKPYTGGK